MASNRMKKKEEIVPTKSYGRILCILIFLLFPSLSTEACSVLYYIDEVSGTIYIVNNEDYWYDTKAYIQIHPKTNKKYARLWYGWDDFAQGGVNEKGLFFDGAVTPEQPESSVYTKPKGNLGDAILANCSNVEEALMYLEDKKIALSNAHLMFGDKDGNAVVVEWINGQRKLVHRENNWLLMTNFLLSDPEKGNYPCRRFNSIEENLIELKEKNRSLSFNEIGNTVGQAVQLPAKDKNGRLGGTLYTSFINLSDMEFILVPKLDNKQLIKWSLSEEFSKNKSQKIKLF